MLYTSNDGPTNEDRAAWAREAVLRFAEITRHDGTYIDDTDALSETVQDLLGDVLHLLCRNDVSPGSVLLNALSCFAEERAEEGEPIPDLVGALQAICKVARHLDMQSDSSVDALTCTDSEWCAPRVPDTPQP